MDPPSHPDGHLYKVSKKLKIDPLIVFNEGIGEIDTEHILKVEIKNKIKIEPQDENVPGNLPEHKINDVKDEVAIQCLKCDKEWVTNEIKLFIFAYLTSPRRFVELQNYF